MKYTTTPSIYWPKGKDTITFVGGSYSIFQEQKFLDGKWQYGKWGWRYCDSSGNHYFEVDERFDSDIAAKEAALGSGKVTSPFGLITRQECKCH